MADRYDYIIVGAGSAGCLLASRLSADPRTSVLLLESGEEVTAADRSDVLSDRNPIPLLGAPEYAWFRYDDILARRTPEQEARPYPRGRGVGGSSIVHGHVYVRGEFPDDYDLWAAEGCAGWAAQDVLPILVALEDDHDFGDRPYHGDAGPVPVDRPPREDWSDLDRALQAAATDAGHPEFADVAEPGSTGFSSLSHSLRDNRRFSAATVFLDPVRSRPNLELRCGATVERIQIDGGTARGVIVDGAPIEGREVIVAAGAVHSPTVLMRSGVGPAAALRDLGIAVVRDAPVGANLQDHALIWLGARPDEPVPERPARLTNVGLRYSSGLPGTGRNDIMISPANLPPSTGMIPALGVTIWQQFSRGTLRLVSTDPERRPELDMDMLSDERDVVRLRQALRSTWELMDHPAFAGFTQDLEIRADGDPLTRLPADDAELDAWIRANCIESAHVSGTCRMGAADDPRSVVDPDCKVIGVDRLRVVDGSVFPEVPRGNTYCPTLVVAEMIARRLVSA